MKKIFVPILALFALLAIFSGINKFFDVVFIENSSAYNVGYNVGIILGPTLKILFGLFIIKNCYQYIKSIRIQKS